MTRAEELLYWMRISKENFEIELVVSENRLESQYFVCTIEPFTALGTIENVYDIIFICSIFYERIVEILLLCGISKNCIKSDIYLYNKMPKIDKMIHYAEKIQKTWEVDSRIVQRGDFSYGALKVCGGETESKVEIGKFCSIALGATVILSEHNVDWCTTYPFNEMMYEFEYIKGHPNSKGDVIIGNDVWIGMNSTILSGVHIGNGCVIAANAVVTKDVEAYSIVGGNPAKVIRKRFDNETIKKLESIEWWNWKKEYIYDAIPILQSNDIKGLLKYYDNVVRNGKEKDEEED